MMISLNWQCAMLFNRHSARCQLAARACLFIKAVENSGLGEGYLNGRKTE
jgi:hypothetical protein